MNVTRVIREDMKKKKKIRGLGCSSITSGDVFCFKHHLMFA